jgi:hypothetical protein
MAAVGSSETKKWLGTDISRRIGCTSTLKIDDRLYTFHSFDCTPRSNTEGEEVATSPLHSFEDVAVRSCYVLSDTSTGLYPMIFFKFAKPLTSLEETVKRIYYHVYCQCFHPVEYPAQPFEEKSLKITVSCLKDGKYEARWCFNKGGFQPGWLVTFALLQDRSSLVSAANLIRDQIVSQTPHAVAAIRRLPLQTIIGLFHLTAPHVNPDYYSVSIDDRKVISSIQILSQKIMAIIRGRFRIPFTYNLTPGPIQDLPPPLQTLSNKLAARCVEQLVLSQAQEGAPFIDATSHAVPIRDELVQPYVQSQFDQFKMDMYGEIPALAPSLLGNGIDLLPEERSQANAMIRALIIDKVIKRHQAAQPTRSAEEFHRSLPDAQLDLRIDALLQTSPYSKKDCSIM